MCSQPPTAIDIHRPLAHVAIAEDNFDRITRLAAQFFEVGLACFTVIGSAGEAMRSCAGTVADPAGQLLSDALAILPPQGMAVPDLRDDARFASHAAVAGTSGTPHARFYAAMPVRCATGERIGALSLLDPQPRQFCADALARLADFATLIGSELAAIESRRSLSRQNQREKSLRELLDHFPEGVMMLDSAGAIVSCNEVAERMYAPAGQNLIGVLTSELTAADPQRLGQLLEAGIVDQIQAIARRVDGSEFPAEFSIKILGTPEAPSYALIVRDISARKAEEYRVQMADERRRNYFVTATHELRTPMASVLGFSELLLRRDFAPDEGRELIEIVHRQAMRLVNLINEMLDLARIESGGREALDMRQQDAAAILAATLSGLSGLGAGHRIRSGVAPDLPPLQADAGKLQQALTNIVSNAVKYSDGASTIDIDVFAAAIDTRRAIAFRVSDRGVGMTLEEQARIYEPFFRAGGKPDTPGTGLGMTIFKEIIDLHGGLVEIASTPGAGTTVTFTLPAIA